MTAQLITTTATEGLRPLGSSGQRSFELITQTLAQAGRTQEAQLFAEPEQSVHGDGADWYTELSGRVVRLDHADPAVREAGLARLQELLSGVAEVAADLSGAREPDRQRLGEALQNTLRYPGDDAVFLVLSAEAETPPQPVLVNWAWERESQGGAVSAQLTSRFSAPTPNPVPAPAAQPVPDPPPPEPAAPRRFTWVSVLLWLVVAGLVTAVLYLLLPACALRGLTFADFCPPTEIADETLSLDDLERDRAMLENRIARAERELAELDAACTPPARPVAPPPQEETRAPPSDIERRLTDQNAGDGEMEIALAWDDQSDLDLHLYCPDGAHVFYNHRTEASCGGTLDIDANSGGPLQPDPIEHVYFSDPPAGTYTAVVHLFRDRRSGAPHPFTLVIKLGDKTETLRGEVSQSRKEWRHDFDYSP